MLLYTEYEVNLFVEILSMLFFLFDTINKYLFVKITDAAYKCFKYFAPSNLLNVIEFPHLVIYMKALSQSSELYSSQIKIHRLSCYISLTYQVDLCSLSLSRWRLSLPRYWCISRTVFPCQHSSFYDKRRWSGSLPLPRHRLPSLFYFDELVNMVPRNSCPDVHEVTYATKEIDRISRHQRYMTVLRCMGL